MQTWSPTDPLYFDLEVERTTWRNKNLTRKRKALERLAIQEPNSLVSPNLLSPFIQEEEEFIMAEEEPRHQPPSWTLHDYLANIGPWYFNTIARSDVMTRNVEMRASLIQLIQQKKIPLFLL